MAIHLSLSNKRKIYWRRIAIWNVPIWRNICLHCDVQIYIQTVIADRLMNIQSDVLQRLTTSRDPQRSENVDMKNCVINFGIVIWTIGSFNSFHKTLFLNTSNQLLWYTSKCCHLFLGRIFQNLASASSRYKEAFVYFETVANRN